MKEDLPIRQDTQRQLTLLAHRKPHRTDVSMVLWKGHKRAVRTNRSWRENLDAMDETIER